MTIAQDAEAAPRRGKPVKRGSLRQRAYDQLKQMILSGALHPGERLSEARLSAALGVSRTPLREALMRLETEGLVIGKPNSGYVVVQLDIETVRDLLVVREGLDGYAAELAAGMATSADLDRLRGVMGQIEELGRTRTRAPEHVARELELGLKVHEVIVAATGNRILREMTTRIYEQLRTALWLEVLWIDLWDEAVAEHRAIVEAIIARDGRRACEAARKHVRASIDNISRIQDIQLHRRRAGGLLPPAGI